LDSWRAYAGYSCGGNEDYIDVSERQLEQRSTIAVGVSSKTYIRVRRFNDALRLMKTWRYPNACQHRLRAELREPVSFHPRPQSLFPELPRKAFPSAPINYKLFEKGTVLLRCQPIQLAER